MIRKIMEMTHMNETLENIIAAVIGIVFLIIVVYFIAISVM